MIKKYVVYLLLILNLVLSENNIVGGIFEAIESGSMHEVRKCVSKNPNCIQDERDGKYPMDFAIENEYVQIVKFLLENGDDAKYAKVSAISLGKANILKLLLKNPKTFDKDDIGKAIEKGHLEVVKLFIENGKYHFGKKIANDIDKRIEHTCKCCNCCSCCCDNDLLYCFYCFSCYCFYCCFAPRDTPRCRCCLSSCLVRKYKASQTYKNKSLLYHAEELGYSDIVAYLKVALKAK